VVRERSLLHCAELTFTGMFLLVWLRIIRKIFSVHAHEDSALSSYFGSLFQ
jgi:hypothetical protein